MTDKGKNSRKINLLFLCILVIFVSIYTAGNYYVGLRFFQSVQSLIGPYSSFYWGSFALFATSLLAARLGKRFYPEEINSFVARTGDYWLGTVYYSLLVWTSADILHFIIINFVHTTPKIARYPSLYSGLAVLSIVFLLLLYGTWNARRPRIVHYNITIRKTVHNLPELHVVMVSDIHLGLEIGNKRLDEMVDSINKLNPDLVFLAGDTIDEDVRFFINNKMPEVLKKLQPGYGVYAVLGNHEHIGGNSKLAIEYLQHAGATVLVDECIKINNQLYIAGRDDRMAGHTTGNPRLELSRLLDGIDRNLPIILLDHQPVNLEEGQRNGIDLQLSGHTHNGQFFPNNLISRRVFENSWGYLRKGEFQIIVSSGFGTWGPPIRIGTNSEILDIKISFSE